VCVLACVHLCVCVCVCVCVCACKQDGVELSMQPANTNTSMEASVLLLPSQFPLEVHVMTDISRGAEGRRQVNVEIDGVGGEDHDGIVSDVGGHHDMGISHAVSLLSSQDVVALPSVSLDAELMM